MKPIGARGFATLGAGLTAVSFGLARYAFGLFVPPIRAELELSADWIGLIGSLAFVSFAIASVFAPLLANRMGARNAAVLAGGFAFSGLGLISVAQGASVLAMGIFACGLSTGLMMPALAAGVHATVRPALQGRVNAVMNAGTSVGLMVSVPTVLLLSGAWRSAYGSFAMLAAAGMIASWLLVPSASRADGGSGTPAPPISRAQWHALIRLSAFGFATGFAGSAYWIFAPDLLVVVGDLPSRLTGALWLAVGMAGLAGASASDLGDRLGQAGAQALSLTALGAALVLLAVRPGELPLALTSALVFGWAYMTLSGLYLVSGIRLLPVRPSLGPVLPFLAITIGQAFGSPVVGWTIERIGHAQTFNVFAALAVAIALLSPLYPRHAPAHGPGRSADRPGSVYA